MCELDGAYTEDAPAAGFKVAIFMPDSTALLSPVTGVAYPAVGAGPQRMPQNDDFTYRPIINSFLPVCNPGCSAFSYKMIGRTAVFVDRDAAADFAAGVARDMCEHTRKEAMAACSLVLLAAVVSEDVCTGTYTGANRVLAGRALEFTEELVRMTPSLMPGARTWLV